MVWGFMVYGVCTKRQTCHKHHIYLQHLINCSLDKLTDAFTQTVHAARLCNAQLSGSIQKRAPNTFWLASLAILTSWSRSSRFQLKFAYMTCCDRDGPQLDLRGNKLGAVHNIRCGYKGFRTTLRTSPSLSFHVILP
jgi:hypothetical protein